MQPDAFHSESQYAQLFRVVQVSFQRESTVIGLARFTLIAPRSPSFLHCELLAHFDYAAAPCQDIADIFDWSSSDKFLHFVYIHNISRWTPKP
jgi:hypothetical protein